MLHFKVEYLPKKTILLLNQVISVITDNFLKGLNVSFIKTKIQIYLVQYCFKQNKEKEKETIDKLKT